jgi:hypothetical protein
MTSTYLVTTRGSDIFMHLLMVKREERKDMFTMFQYLYLPVPFHMNTAIKLLPRHDLQGVGKLFFGACRRRNLHNGSLWLVQMLY